jgi:hypothetical protein
MGKIETITRKVSDPSKIKHEITEDIGDGEGTYKLEVIKDGIAIYKLKGFKAY